MFKFRIENYLVNKVGDMLLSSSWESCSLTSSREDVEKKVAELLSDWLLPPDNHLMMIFHGDELLYTAWADVINYKYNRRAFVRLEWELEENWLRFYVKPVSKNIKQIDLPKGRYLINGLPSDSHHLCYRWPQVDWADLRDLFTEHLEMYFKLVKVKAPEKDAMQKNPDICAAWACIKQAL